MRKISIAKIDVYLERFTDPNRRAVLRSVKKYVLELEGYQQRVGEFATRYVNSDPNDILFYKRAGINLKKDFPTQIVEFKERIVKEAINNGNIDKDLIENVLAYFCCDVVKIEELYNNLVNPEREDKEKELIEKLDGLLKTLNGLTWHHLSSTLDKSETERIVHRISERLHKHGLKGIGRGFLVRLGVMKAPKRKEPGKFGATYSSEPVTIEEMEVIANRIEKEVEEWELLLNDHAINSEESKLIKEVLREQKKTLSNVTPEIVKETIVEKEPVEKISFNKIG